jgi:DNA-binding MarR family transcriptional regulator
MSDEQDLAGRPADGQAPPPPDSHPALAFDDVVHQRARLGILAVLTEAGQADFPYLRSVLGLTDGNLGRHLEILDNAGLIMITKGYHRRRPRTWAAITAAGRRALDSELASMNALMERLKAAAESPSPGPARQPPGPEPGEPAAVAT